MALEKELLHLGEEDIRYGRIISVEDLDAMDSNRWKKNNLDSICRFPKQ